MSGLATFGVSLPYFSELGNALICSDLCPVVPDPVSRLFELNRV